MRRRCPVLLLCACLVLLMYAPVFGAEDSATTVFLVRHAEKQSEAENPDLSIAGQIRAQSLIHVLGSSGITGVYTSQYMRTIKTAEPLAAFLKLKSVEVDANKTPDLVKSILADHKGKSVLVVGHSNTVPEIITALGGSIAPIEDWEYDNLYVVTVPPSGKTVVARIKFGEPTK